MVERTLNEATLAMHGALLDAPADAVFRGAAIDSRKVEAGTLFFALAGARTDGHAFVDQALARGAAAAVVHRTDAPADRGVRIRVDDTYRALHDLTRAIRKQVPRHLVGITGSVGKTTTKELLAALLGARFDTAFSQGNFNNTYGFPLSLLNIHDGAEWMVAEMGMSTPGELGKVSRLGRPNVAVFTTIQAAHLANFGDLEQIMHAKAELLDGLPDDGLVIANADDPWVMKIAARHPGRVVRYGYDDDADVRASRPTLHESGIGTSFTLSADGQTVNASLPLHGFYNVDNALAAAACAHTLGVSLEEIAAVLGRFDAGAPMRGEVDQLANGVTLIDDAYNANPHATKMALESAAAMPGRRRVAVLGDMLELGPDAPTYHREVGERAAALGFDHVVGVGPLAEHMVDAAKTGGTETTWVADAEAAGEHLVQALSDGQISQGDVVLLKGSRGIGLEVATRAVKRAVETGNGDTQEGGA